MTDKRREKEVEKMEQEITNWNGFEFMKGSAGELAEALVDAGFGSSARFEIGEILKPAKGLRIEHWEQSIKPIQYSLEKE